MCSRPDEDGTEFEKEVTEALERLGVSVTADKLSTVPSRRRQSAAGK